MTNFIILNKEEVGDEVEERPSTTRGAEWLECNEEESCEVEEWD